jgi:hypothetical protein
MTTKMMTMHAVTNPTIAIELEVFGMFTYWKKRKKKNSKRN